MLKLRLHLKVPASDGCDLIWETYQEVQLPILSS